jgi:hypothetical protein
MLTLVKSASREIVERLAVADTGIRIRETYQADRLVFAKDLRGP